MMPTRIKRRRIIGNWKPIPIKAEVRKTVDKRPLISKILPIPRETDLAKKISICHFIMILPNIKPIKNRKTERGRNLITSLNSFIFKAGFKKYKTWAIRKGIATTSPVVTPQLMARLIN